MGMDFLRNEWSRQNINMNRISIDVFIGGQILGLKGISNPKLQPQLEYLSPTGLGLYKVPLRRVSQYCIGGNYPSVKFMKAQLKNNWVPEMLRQVADYTKPPRPDHLSISTPPWFTGEDTLGLRKQQKSHLKLLESAGDLIDCTDFNDAESDDESVMTTVHT